MPSGAPRNLCRWHAHGHGRGAVSRESSRLRGTSVLDAENLCSVSISEEMGPGGACVIWHLPPPPPPNRRSQGSGCLFPPTPPPRASAFRRFDTNPETSPRIPCSWFAFKMVMIILFWNSNGSTSGGGEVWRGGGGLQFIFIFPCMITLRVCSVVFD